MQISLSKRGIIHKSACSIKTLGNRNGLHIVYNECEINKDWNWYLIVSVLFLKDHL